MHPPRIVHGGRDECSWTNKRWKAATVDTTDSTSTSRSFQEMEDSNEDDDDDDDTADADVRTFGNWEEVEGNFMLRPSIEIGPPRALIHFLGGALVGAAPHVSYRYVLERLADEGYLIVATPYSLSFDHLSTCDAILSRFENIAPTIARTYGALPVVGVGHSCGALLQLLITSLFPDTPRAANALISYNNKPVSEAVPLFEEVVAPFFTYVAARNDTNRPDGIEVLSTGLELAKVMTLGKLPSDRLLNKAIKLAIPPFLTGMMKTSDNVDVESNRNKVKIPMAVRDAFATFALPIQSGLVGAGVTPLVYDFFETLEQIPKLIGEVADGARDFNPTPPEVIAAARRAYRARRTLIIGFTDDPLDESDEIEELLQAAGKIIRMKRPMVNIDVQNRKLPGGHAAPLIAPPLDLANRLEDLLGVEAAKEQLQYSQADQTVSELTKWLEESNL
jgi:Protein of unknown function (DUF1350)